MFLLLLGIGFRFPVQAFDAHARRGVGFGFIAVGAFLMAIFAAVEVSNRFQLRTASVDGNRRAKISPEPFGAEIDLGVHNRLLTSAQSHFTSIRETITPFPGHYLHEFSMTIELPRSTVNEGARQAFYVPILFHARGAMVTDLTAAGASGGQLVILSEAANRGLVEHLLRRSADVLFQLTGSPATEDDPLKTLGAYIARDWPLGGSSEVETYDPQDEPAFRAAMSLLAQAEMNPSFPSPEAWKAERERFLRLCRVIVESQPVFVRVEEAPGETLVLGFSYRRWQENVARGRKNWIRYATGLLPYRHQIPIQQAHRTNSYEVRFNAPPNQYVYESRVATDRTADMVVVSATEGWGALAYATATLRPVDTTTSSFARSLLQLVVDIRERPFGLLGVVAILALAEASLIWVLGIFHPTFFPSGATRLGDCGRVINGVARAGGSAGLSAVVGAARGAPSVVECGPAASADATTILLALPALVAGWVGAQFTTERMQWTSIATLWGLLLTGLISIGSTTLAVWKLVGRPLDDDWLGIQHPAWAFFMLASAMLALDLTARAVTRSIRFARRVARSGLVERYTI